MEIRVRIVWEIVIVFCDLESEVAGIESDLSEVVTVFVVEMERFLLEVTDFVVEMERFLLEVTVFVVEMGFFPSEEKLGICNLGGRSCCYNNHRCAGTYHG